MVLAHAAAAYLRAILLVYLQARMDDPMMLGFLLIYSAFPLASFSNARTEIC